MIQVAIELLAAVTVQKVMKIAREVSGVSEKSTSEAELNFSSAASSRDRQRTADTQADTQADTRLNTADTRQNTADTQLSDDDTEWTMS